MNSTAVSNRKIRRAAEADIRQMARDVQSRLGRHMALTVGEVRRLAEDLHAHGLLPAGDLEIYLRAAAENGPIGTASAFFLMMQGTRAACAGRALSWLDTFHDSTDNIALAAKHPADPPNEFPSICGKLGSAVQRQALERFLTNDNPIGFWNHYFSVNPLFDGRAKRAGEDGFKANFMLALDFDRDKGNRDEDVLEKLAPLKPSHVVLTGGGVQAFIRWERTEDRAEMEHRKARAARVQKTIGSDVVSDLSRVMRLPFTINVLKPSKRREGREIALVVPYVYPS